MPSSSGEFQAYLLLLILLTSAVSILKADHLCTHLSTSEAYLFAAEDTYDIQQLFLEGFRTNRVNAYNLRRFGFTGDGGVEQCIIVNYIFQCDNSTGEECANVFNRACGEKTDDVEAIEWSFLWTTFDTSNTIGRILLNLAIYDLRVFGFELCDVYKDPVNITLIINSSDPTIYFSSCDHICIGLLEFTALLPGLSGEPSLQHPNLVPEAIGYAASWNSSENYLEKEDTVITLISAFMVLSTKLFILAFCYEILKLIRKHRISHKTHEWFYRYWGAQLLIVATLIFVTYFDTLNQKNRPALLFFYASLGLDGLIWVIFILSWLPKCVCFSAPRGYVAQENETGDQGHLLLTFPNQGTIKFPKGTQIRQCLKIHMLSQETEITTEATINFLGGTNINFSSDINVPLQGKNITVPKETMIHFPDNTKITLPQGTKINLPRETTITVSEEKRVQLQTVDLYDITMNEIKLKENTEIILSRMTESYELGSPTTMTFSSGKVTMRIKNESLITLAEKTRINLPSGEFVHVSEGKQISLPKRITIVIIPATSARSAIDESVPPPLTLMCECCGCCSCWKTSWSVLSNLASLAVFLSFSSYLSQALPAITISYYLNPTASLIRLGFYELIIVVLLLEVSYLLFLFDKCTWFCYFNKHKEIPEEIEIKVDDDDDYAQETDKGKSYICKYIHDGKLIGCNEICGCDSKYNCTGWLYLITFLQICIMIFIIGLSTALLYFLLNVVIQQTSSPNNQFKDILAIVPTIALNLWLLSRQVDIGKALKDIAHKASEYNHHNHPNDHQLPV